MKEEVEATEPVEGPEPGTLSQLIREIAADESEPEANAAQSLVPGQVLGRFRVVRELGRGGFGVVWEAEDLVLPRRVALKAVRTGSRSSLRSERLLEEAEAAARLAHPNIVTLHDLGRSEHGPYLVLELLDGETLHQRLTRGPVPPAEAVRIATGVARGLAHAHARGVVHRDLKPGNVFLTRDGGVKILDFGLAHAFGLRRPEGGTPAYMAPEQWSGAPEDERTDVFALGVLLHRMLAGRLPFPEDDGKSVQGPGAAPRLEVAGLPALGDLVAAMLEKAPVDRPRDGREVLAALEVLAEILRAAGRAAPGPEDITLRVPRAPTAWWRTRRAQLGALALTVLLAAALALAWQRGRRVVEVAGPGRLLVAVADLENGTDDRELDGLAGMLATSLEQSNRLDVLTRGRLVDVLGAKGEAGLRLHDERALEAARRAGAAVLVQTRLHRLGDLFVAEGRGVVPETGARLFSFREQQLDKRRLPELLDRLSERIRRGLGEEEAALRASAIALASTVTPNFAAWEHYTRGMACYEGAEFAASFDACLAELRRAVELDPDFALAHLQIAHLSFSAGLSLEAQKVALEPALRRMDRIPPRDRLRVEGWAAHLAGDDVRAKELLRRAAEAAPTDKMAWWRAGDIPFHRDEYAEAAVLIRRVHELDPSWPAATEHLVTALGAIGDTAGLRRVAAELEGLGRDPHGLAALCQARLWLAPERAVATCEEAIAAGAGSIGDQFLAIALLHVGERARLREHVARMSKGQPSSAFGPAMSLLLAGQEGRWPEVVERIGSLSDDDGGWAHAAWAELLAGSPDGARFRAEARRTLELNSGLVSNLAVHAAYRRDLELAREFEPYLPAGSPRLATYEAVRTWRAGDRTAAIEALKKVAATAPISADPAMPHPAFLLGEVLSEAGRDAEAVTALERFLSAPLTYPSWQVPRAHLFLARSRLRLGDGDGARREVAALLEVWRNATPDQPLLAEARKLAGELGVR